VKFPADKKVYIVGMSGISEELKAEGIRSFGGVVSSIDMDEHLLGSLLIGTFRKMMVPTQ
jgi:hypothetical protein